MLKVILAKFFTKQDQNRLVQDREPNKKSDQSKIQASCKAIKLNQGLPKACPRPAQGLPTVNQNSLKCESVVSTLSINICKMF